MSDSNVRYVGLDVHKRIVQVCVLAEDGSRLMQERLALSTLAIFAKQHLKPTDRAVLEATTNTWSVVRVLQPFVAEVVVSNPMTTKAIASAKVKTDKVDALVLAQLLRCDFLPRVWQPDGPTLEMRRLTTRRAGLVSDRTRLKNRLHSVLAQRLIDPPDDRLFNEKGLDWLRTLELDAEGRMLLDSDLRLLQAVEEELARLEEYLAKKGHADERVKLLMTLPGVDVAVAESLLAALGTVERFESGDKAAAYLGLVPSTRQSADRCYHGPITKSGRSHSRWMLVQAAQHVRLHPGPLGVFFRRLANKKNHNVAVVATARKLVMIAWHMLKNNEPYRYAQPRLTADKLARLRVKATGKRRTTGPKKGVKCGGSQHGTKGSAKLPGGSRTIKPLAEVYCEEGLPEIQELPAGERKMLRDSGTDEYAQTLTAAHVVPRKRKPQTAKA